MNAVINTLGPLEEALQTMAAAPNREAAAHAAAEAEEMLSVVRRGAARTKAIVQALHNYSRGDEQRPRELSVARSVDDTLDLLRHHLRHVQIEKQIDPDLRITGFPGQIDQVFMNLITNAAQAVGGRERGGTVRVMAAARAADVEITVSDDGPGIAAEVSPASSIRSSPPRTSARAPGSGSRSSTGSSIATAAASRSRASSARGRPSGSRCRRASRSPPTPTARLDKLAARPDPAGARCQVDIRLAIAANLA